MSDLKTQLAAVLVDVTRGHTQVVVARRLRTTQPKVSDLRAGRLANFSADRLLAWILRWGCDVQIKIRAGAGAVVVRQARR